MPKNLKNTPLVSVIIPVYNEEKYLKKCLDSLTDQEFKSFEVIVIDDGSTDATATIASKYAVKFKRITHGGPGRAKNYGAEITQGKILVFLDADIVVDKNYLSNITKPILEGKCAATYTLEEYVMNKNNIWARCWNINADLPITKRVDKNNQRTGHAFRAILRKNFLTTSGFNPTWGYLDDLSLSKYKFKILPAKNAICYHYNPDTFKDVFLSARWIGRSADFNLTFRNIKRYFLLNSLRISIRRITKGAPLFFVIFKTIFDFGLLTGILFKNSKNNFAK